MSGSVGLREQFEVPDYTVGQTLLSVVPASTVGQTLLSVLAHPMCLPMKKMYLPILLLLAILGLLSIQYMSPTGIGVSPDSVDYLSLARSLAAGDGYQVGYRPAHQIEAKAHFPPLFPGLIAGLARMTHQDAWPAAGGLNS
ncbi:MAG: hypothetical protein ACI9QL_001536, partial [Candidatus Omnitrophota bacterium]